MPLKRKDKDSQQERREIQPKWPGVYETEEGWTAIEPRSDVHKHTVTLGESKDHEETGTSQDQFNLDSHSGLLQYTTNYFHQMDQKKN